MNKSIKLAVVLALLMLLTACASSETASTSDENTAEVAAPDAEQAENTDSEVSIIVRDRFDPSTTAPVALIEETSEARVIEHLGGEVAVPLEPETIVSLSLDDSLLALNVTPAAAFEWDETYYLADRLSETQSIGYTVGPNLEMITAVGPDLILLHTKPGNGIEQYDLLAEIAPTVIVSDPEADFRQSVRDIGLVLGLAEEAEQRIAMFNQMAQEASATVTEIVGDEPTALLNVRQDHFRLYGIKVGYSGPTLYGELGMTPADIVYELVPETFNTRISLEVLPDIDAQRLFVLAPETVDQQYQDMIEQPLWQTIPAVEAGNVYRVTADHWYSSEILAMERKIADVIELLEAADSQ